MSTAARPQDEERWLQAGTANTMDASSLSEYQSVCVSFLSGFGIGRDQAVTLCDRLGITSFSPRVLTPQLLDLAAASGAENHRCLYVSTPITTGRHHLRADNSARHKIINGNLERAKVIVKRLRAARSETVIDPTGLEDVATWQQEDYHSLWVAVIDRFAQIIVFVDDWQYSVGCTKEFGAACRLGLPMFTQDLQPMSCDEGRRLLSSAGAEVRSVSGPQAPLLRAIAEVEELAATHAPPDGER